MVTSIAGEIHRNFGRRKPEILFQKIQQPKGFLLGTLNALGTRPSKLQQPVMFAGRAYLGPQAELLSSAIFAEPNVVLFLTREFERIRVNVKDQLGPKPTFFLHLGRRILVEGVRAV